MQTEKQSRIINLNKAIVDAVEKSGLDTMTIIAALEVMKNSFIKNMNISPSFVSLNEGETDVIL